MIFKLDIWLRAIRFRFLAASAIAVTCGLALTIWYQPQNFSLTYSVLTYIGIFCLHSSVDLLNDYWDFNRGIDLRTKKTKFSGGTGVLPQGLLKPRHVYFAGMSFLILGLIIGCIFVYFKGFVIAIILLFAALSIVLYSSKLVNLGLGELFVGTKGALIVVGTFYVQTTIISLESILLGSIIGVLSSLVLFINSIPDIVPDRQMGRKTLAIIFEKRSNQFILMFTIGLIVGIYLLTLGFFTTLINSFFSVIPCILLIPYIGLVLYRFKNFLYKFKRNNDDYYINIMANTVLFSRFYGISLIVGIIFAFLYQT
ncbi:prenyltransferase [Candidatus Nitrosocosmicus arcticus]|uniref:UbiA prenyltransferase n=1 Tax=Candidatus Nitrosocosmicus arcticus TaxID=2035267 RepID=A0A557ST95_9ARCH|nr:prenyltransferase [Candidatus Nitrosocosmicus arcticus]TVP39824.1 UbiA prenyltransferase [Candidatus Nitrosocosmicus arcticus]